jgi:hypothetical protein
MKLLVERELYFAHTLPANPTKRGERTYISNVEFPKSDAFHPPILAALPFLAFRSPFRLSIPSSLASHRPSFTVFAFCLGLAWLLSPGLIPRPLFSSRIHPIWSINFSLSDSCARDFVNDLVFQDNVTSLNLARAIHIRSYGNYGNMFIQLITGLQFVLLTHLQEVFVDDGFCFLKTNMSFVTPFGIEIKTIESSESMPYPRARWIDGMWIFPCCWCAGFTWRIPADLVRADLLKLFPPVPVDPNALYLYLRGGADIWYSGTEQIHPSYSQPPCSFYLDAMQGFRRAVALGDGWNPCLNVTIRSGAFWEPYDDRRAFAMMIHSRFIALARSSRSQAILALSPVRKRFWRFDIIMEKGLEEVWWRGFRLREFGEGMNCEMNAEYRNKEGAWAASSEQIQLILTAKCNWATATDDPEV